MFAVIEDVAGSGPSHMLESTIQYQIWEHLADSSGSFRLLNFSAWFYWSLLHRPSLKFSTPSFMRQRYSGVLENLLKIAELLTKYVDASKARRSVLTAPCTEDGKSLYKGFTGKKILMNLIIGRAQLDQPVESLMYLLEEETIEFRIELWRIVANKYTVTTKKLSAYSMALKLLKARLLLIFYLISIEFHRSK
ncbi:unnamed protein product [Dibothriocephalus latus]|uniref:Uncharacterized protein n=1 Tax=Dibothriocephalus latus TaxID=60516 RepID=A0A3P7L7V9_DIBLA|nr:unnamed protein product [Dibothriocephalus latus]